MTDMLECSIKAPHEPHPWQDAEQYNGFVPQMVPRYHYCRGKQWNNTEVYEHLKGLMRKALLGEYALGEGGLTIEAQIMEEIWPEMVGFLQPEDMPMTVTLGGDNIPDREFLIGPGQIMQIPADPMTRIADALEKIEEYMRPAEPVKSPEPVDNRHPECVKAWPDCQSGEYNPACCRFPKSCSCES